MELNSVESTPPRNMGTSSSGKRTFFDTAVDRAGARTVPVMADLVSVGFLRRAQQEEDPCDDARQDC
jgi:hypothetical protein